ncbi:phosphotransferase [Cellulosilyticum sp. I15G10I2]|uniref:phosphotransferase n=1 Tax=Cellulosilyticum sp. I15G10I2 TaxID=1892843 RepID=UPI00085C9EB2|nr:phosphotransferase [Cellulosilyticum sp. I15G10I2]
MSYDLSGFDKDSLYLIRLIAMYFDCDMLSSHKIGEGFYGVVYLVKIKKDPYKVIVKLYKHSGRNVLESEQLSLLRKYALLKVPQTYHIHHYSEAIPFEVLIMEFIEGVNASMLPTDHPNSASFAQDMIENLLHLHSISHKRGFGTRAEMFDEWKPCLRNRLNKMHQLLHSNYKDCISPYVMEAADKSLEAFDTIFSEPIKKSSLIHSDYNLWNILVDKKSAKITAVIDPIDAGWADKEMDLFHLQNADGDRFKLLERYKHNAHLSHLFPVKNAFYWFWDDIKHMQNMGWYEEERFTSFGKKLITLMQEHIGRL